MEKHRLCQEFHRKCYRFHGDNPKHGSLCQSPFQGEKDGDRGDRSIFPCMYLFAHELLHDTEAFDTFVPLEHSVCLRPLSSQPNASLPYVSITLSAVIVSEGQPFVLYILHLKCV